MLRFLRLDYDALTGDNYAWIIDSDLLKKHGRIDFSDEDANLEFYLRGAIEWAETATLRAIVAREHRLVLREFPCWGRQEIKLPRGRATAVDSIQYVAGGVAYDLTGPTSSSPQGSDYQEDLRDHRAGVLMPLQGSSWPSVDYDAIAPVVVTYTAGWAASEIPPEIVTAIMFAAADAFDMRNSADVSAMVLANTGNSLAAREALISGWRLTTI